MLAERLYVKMLAVVWWHQTDKKRIQRNREREREERRWDERRMGALQSSLLPVRGSTPLRPPAYPPPVVAHTMWHIFYPRLGWATHRLQSAAADCVWANVCVCPSTNSALSFSWICSDCPHTKLPAGPVHQYFIPCYTICCTVQHGSGLFVLHLSYLKWWKVL